MLFAFAPLSKTNPSIHWTEILTIITVTTMLFEEIRQVSVSLFENKTTTSKFLTD
jgi:hypothetical protein